MKLHGLFNMRLSTSYSLYELMSFIILIFHSNTISWSTHKIDKVQDNSSFNIDPFLLLTEDDGYGCHMRSHTQLRSATQP